MPSKKWNALTGVGVQKKKTPGMYADGNGLNLRVEPSGAKRWVLRVTIAGKRHNLGLGGYPSVGLREARNPLNKSGHDFSGGYRGSYRGNFREIPWLWGPFPRVFALPFRSGGAVAGLSGPFGGPRPDSGPLRPRQPASWPSPVSRLPSPKSSARRSRFFASPR